MTPVIILLNHGRLVAEGQIRQIRDLIDSHPHHIVIVCNEYRKLAARLLTGRGRGWGRESSRRHGS